MSTSVGSLVHFSIPVTDLALGAKFYSELLGWKFLKMSETYWMVEGGLGALSLEKESANKGTMPILYFSVVSIEKSLSLASALGGETILPKMDSGDGKSFFATITDLNGNIVGLWAKS